MAKGKDALKTLINQQDRTKVLSSEWLDREPSTADFGLEGKDINEIYREYSKFKNSQDIRIAGLEKQRPENPKKKFLPEKTKETYVTLVFFIITVCYGVLAGEHRNWILLGALIAATVVSFVLYFRKINATDKVYTDEVKRINEGIAAVKAEVSPYTEDYRKLEEYAGAVYDHQAWKRRNDQNFWKSASKDEIVDEIVGMNKLLGIESKAVNDGYISLTCETSGSRDFAIYVAHKGALTKNDVTKFVNQCHEEGVYAGTIAALKGVQNDAKLECEDEDITIWTIDDMIRLENKIENSIE